LETLVFGAPPVELSQSLTISKRGWTSEIFWGEEGMMSEKPFLCKISTTLVDVRCSHTVWLKQKHVFA